MERDGKPKTDYFYSRPCGRGDVLFVLLEVVPEHDFYSRPCGRGDMYRAQNAFKTADFYSRPCGRGDSFGMVKAAWQNLVFLLTPLREGRQQR